MSADTILHLAIDKGKHNIETIHAIHNHIFESAQDDGWVPIFFMAGNRPLQVSLNMAPDLTQFEEAHFDNQGSFVYVHTRTCRADYKDMSSQTEST